MEAQLDQGSDTCAVDRSVKSDKEEDQEEDVQGLAAAEKEPEEEKKGQEEKVEPNEEGNGQEEEEKKEQAEVKPEHRSYFKTFLKAPYPEILTFNLNWE